MTDEQRAAADSQIREQQSETKYSIRDFTIGYIVLQFKADLFYIPPYQRLFVWTKKHSVDFIESIILGLPIPMMFVAEIDDGSLEVVDGAQRLQTLEKFMDGEIELKNLKILSHLDGFKFDDMSDAQKRKFGTRPLRIVVLEEETSLERRQELFNRVNTGSMKARPSEIRRGDFENPMMAFVIRMSEDPLFVELCPQSQAKLVRREREELVLRFFAYLERYEQFRHDVHPFLDKYVKERSKDFDEAQLESEFRRMLLFVKNHFPNGFAKTRGANTTPRVRFEALSVGAALALREDPDLDLKDISWIDSSEFVKHTTTHASNSGPKLKGRIEFVRDRMLER